MIETKEPQTRPEIADVITTRAVAVMDDAAYDPGSYNLIDVELDPPRRGELRIKMKASGLCHSDDHIARGVRRADTYPFVLGHEGAGIVDAVGPGTPNFETGDHVVFSFIPFCGRCRWCSQGLQNLCDRGRLGMVGSRFDDETDFRLHLPDGRPVGQLMGIGTFAEMTTVDVSSVVKVPKDIPFPSLALLSCGVGTGYGSAVNAADVQIGQTIIVMGAGGVGIHAVQGAAHAGATHVVVADPVKLKRDTALRVGATHAFASIEAAADFARSVTNGQGADSAIVTVGVVEAENVAQALASIRKAGTVVLTSIGDDTLQSLPIPVNEFVCMQKRLQGSLFGMSRPGWDILAQIDLWKAGTLKLDELVTTTYTIDEVAKGYQDLHEGRNIRGVVVFD